MSDAIIALLVIVGVGIVVRLMMTSSAGKLQGDSTDSAAPGRDAPAGDAAEFDARLPADLRFVPEVDGSTNKATLAFWYKVDGETGDYQHIFSARSLAAEQAQQVWIYKGRVGVISRVDVDNGFWLETKNNRLGVPGHWHHLVVQYDLRKGTAAEAVTVWVDGTRAEMKVRADNNHDGFEALFAAGQTHYIGTTGGEEPFHGCLMHLHVIDGLLVGPEAFLSEDTQPVRYRGDHGANGFSLKFSDAETIGHDDANGHLFDNNSVRQVAE